MTNNAWPAVPIAELGKVITGRTPPDASSEFFGGDVPFVTPSDMDGSRTVETAARNLSAVGCERLKQVLVPYGVAVSCIGWQMGKAVWMNKPFATNQQINTIVPDQTIVNPLFLYYSLRLRRDEILRLGSGGSRTPIVNKAAFSKILLPLPSLADQTVIAAVLGALDDKIEQNRRTGRALEELARATFKAWFVDFEPVKAKAAGQTSFPGLPPAAFATLSDCLTDSPLGPVPQGWEVKPIGDVVTVRGGGTPSTKVPEYWDGGTHFWATPKDLSGLQDPVLLETERRITDAGAECISSGVLPKNTVLLSSRAPVGYTALAKVPIAVNQGFIAMTCDGPLPPHYVLHWTRSALGEIKSRASGTTFPEISKTVFRPIQAVVPSPPVVAEFESFAQSLFDLIEANARQSHQLGELRDYLLPRLLNGSVRVRI